MAALARLAARRATARPRRLRRLRLFLLAGVVSAAATAAPLSPAARAEVDALLARLEASGCEFNRNGTWHKAAEVRPHLLRKLKYLEDRGAVQTAEQFIELAASGSSMTGEPYLVKCGNAAAVRSATWLSSQLQAMRAVR